MKKCSVRDKSVCKISYVPSLNIPAWTKDTHWIFDRKDKKRVLVLLLIHKYISDSLIATLPKDVLFIIIKYVMKYGTKHHMYDKICDPCYKNVISKPRCTYCIKDNDYNTDSYKDRIYVPAGDCGNPYFIETRNICLLCNCKQIYTCYKHNEIAGVCEYCVNY